MMQVQVVQNVQIVRCVETIYSTLQFQLLRRPHYATTTTSDH